MCYGSFLDVTFNFEDISYHKLLTRSTTSLIYYYNLYLVAKKALLFVKALRPIAPCSGTSALSAFVKFQKIVPNSLTRGNTSPRRSSRLWQVFVFCFPENSFLRNAGFSTSLPHCRQMFSGTATRIKVLVGVFSSSIPLPNH